MIYTNEEAAMIDGMIGTLFGGANVAENVRDAYQTVRRHLTEDSLAVSYTHLTLPTTPYV